MPRTEPMTLKAVLAYQQTLQLRAAIAKARNPWADPYVPTEEAAKRLFYLRLTEVRRRDELATQEAEQAETPVPEFTDEQQRDQAAHLAVETLASRAREVEREQQEADRVANRSLERLQRRRREAERDRQQKRNELTVGQRLDRALAAFSVVPATGAAQIGWSTPGSDRPGLAKHGDPCREAHYVARKAIREIEELLDRHCLRDVSKAA